jgi:hypothetical protein
MNCEIWKKWEWSKAFSWLDHTFSICFRQWQFFQAFVSKDSDCCNDLESCYRHLMNLVWGLTFTRGDAEGYWGCCQQHNDL